MLSIHNFDEFIFVVGAPRSGTTTLSQFLKEHPSVCFARIKEPHYFARNDLRGLGDRELRDKVEREYLPLFADCGDGRKVAAEGSVTYLYRPELLEPVVRLWPNSRFIIALRDPLKMLPSLHQRLIYIGDEDIDSFAEAWRASGDRAKGRRIPRTCAEPDFLRYDEAGRFGTYVERLFKSVGRERCHVVIFDDLAEDPDGEYRRVLEFCGLEIVPRNDFRAHRSGSKVRLPWLQRLLKRPPKRIRDYVIGDNSPLRQRDMRRQHKGVRKAILSTRERLLKWNRIAAPPDPLDPRIRREIHDHLKGEIERVGTLIGRELNNWLKVDEQPSR